MVDILLTIQEICQNIELQRELLSYLFGCKNKRDCQTLKNNWWSP